MTTELFKLKLLWISQTFSVPVVNLLTFLHDESQLGESRPEYHNTSMKKINNVRPKQHNKLVTDEERRFQLVSQSGLLKILDLAKTAPAESKLDEISLLLAIKGDSKKTLHFKI